MVDTGTETCQVWFGLQAPLTPGGQMASPSSTTAGKVPGAVYAAGGGRVLGGERHRVAAVLHHVAEGVERGGIGQRALVGDAPVRLAGQVAGVGVPRRSRPVPPYVGAGGHRLGLEFLEAPAPGPGLRRRRASPSRPATRSAPPRPRTPRGAARSRCGAGGRAGVVRDRPGSHARTGCRRPGTAAGPVAGRVAGGSPRTVLVGDGRRGPTTPAAKGVQRTARRSRYPSRGPTCRRRPAA